MKRMLFISLMLLLATSFLLALPVNSETATKVAKNFVLERLGTDYVVSTQKCWIPKPVNPIFMSLI